MRKNYRKKLTPPSSQHHMALRDSCSCCYITILSINLRGASLRHLFPGLLSLVPHPSLRTPWPSLCAPQPTPVITYLYLPLLVHLFCFRLGTIIFSLFVLTGQVRWNNATTLQSAIYMSLNNRQFAWWYQMCKQNPSLFLFLTVCKIRQLLLRPSSSVENLNRKGTLKVVVKWQCHSNLLFKFIVSHFPCLFFSTNKTSVDWVFSIILDHFCTWSLYQ